MSNNDPLLQTIEPGNAGGVESDRSQTPVKVKVAANRRDALANVLDWIADGVALLRSDGSIAFANDTMCELARRADGFRIVDSLIKFSDVEARKHFAGALRAAGRGGSPALGAPSTDFAANKDTGPPDYIVSVRPLLRGQSYVFSLEQAAFLLFIRDPLWRAGNTNILQELFGLTDAEAHLAQALCTGTTTNAYAHERRVSLNTVYSHLKHIREKTGSSSISDLIRKFGVFSVPLRLG